MTDEALRGYDTNTKMNPPLRPQSDVDALIEGLADGSVDVIATDHAPHHADEKALSYDQAPFGITGLETAVPLTFDRLVHTGRIGLARMVELLSVNPARILKVAGGALTEGTPADITVLAPDLPVTITAASQKSLSKNMPFEGWTLKGGVAATIVAGRLVYRNRAVDGLGDWPTAPVE
jgi:dihydroorotase